MKEPTIKSTVLGMMPDHYPPKLKNAIFRSFKKEYAPNGVAWSAKISDVRAEGELLLDEFLSRCKDDMGNHIERFMWRNERE